MEDCSRLVSEACQINDLDHSTKPATDRGGVSEACQINDLDHRVVQIEIVETGFRSLSDQ